jgi:IclR family acetate operon transcriptional repressor
MAVKRSQSASRVLATLEKVAEYQPVGISELARLLGADKSGVQRALATLSHEGWIRTAPGRPTRWELSERIHAIAQVAHGSPDLRHRARPVLEALRDETGETVSLNVVERGRIVVADVLESPHPLRVVLPIGMMVPPLTSATGRAILPYLGPERRLELIGSPPQPAELAAYAETAARGYAISEGVLFPGFTNVAAPVFEADGRPVAAVLISTPSHRMPASDHPRIGALVAAAARQLSRAPAPSVKDERPRLAVG